MAETSCFNSTLTKFEQTLSNGYGLAPKIAESIAEYSKNIFVDNKDVGCFISGQTKYEAITIDQPVGIPRDECKTKTVILTLVDKTDSGLDSQAKRKKVVERLTSEAYEQGGLLTQEDLATLLHSSARTIRRAIKELCDEKIILPLRGNIKNIGRGQTHKKIIIEMALKRYTYSEINRKTHHSITSIERYISKFCKVIHCYIKNMPVQDICYICENSENVINQYIEIYLKHRDECQDQIDILLRKYKDFDFSEESKKKMILVSKWLKK